MLAGTTVSVIIPARNEARAIGSVVRGCIAHTPGLREVVVVDDGSTDGTARAAREAGAHVEKLPTNLGKGSALRRGLEVSRGEVVVFIDGDGQDLPEEIPRLLDALSADVAMVIGSRFLGTFEPGAITAINRLGTRFLTGVLNSLFAAAVTDPVAGFRAAHRAALLRCPSSASRYDIEVDVLLSLLTRGERVVEVPVTRAPRRHGSTGLSPVVDGARILGRIVSHRLGSAGAAGRWKT